MASTVTYTYYHAGPLFTLSDLHTNTLLASRIRSLSNGRFIPIVPQDLEQRDTSPHSIRDQDIRSLLTCDLALFTYDGAELDSGTVVEYMLAKFADIPCVILRTDFRKAGDQGESGGGDPWNLMSSFWPRTTKVVVDSMLSYKQGLAKALEQRNVPDSKVENVTSFDVGGGPVALAAGQGLLDKVAGQVVAAMEEVVKVPARMPKEVRGSVYEWLALMPGFKSQGGSRVETETEVKDMLELLKAKEEKGML
ncbi:hypothetical protein H2198_002946 [Neophaeococcomyces mojaviensis]|uniref:Uncharacterized protein n=1 Tax=Neophaeococcomyces mojaviensis TaxID=3383035 RepID=A0ACC3ACM1_9EURO|nr:hypothetical protein H2198_002946 [Knufia sp. JES_112]